MLAGSTTTAMLDSLYVVRRYEVADKVRHVAIASLMFEPLIIFTGCCGLEHRARFTTGTGDDYFFKNALPLRRNRCNTASCDNQVEMHKASFMV
ncbi:MAG: hypothetical protein ACNYPE_01855 [Candidatus Azotimanducaceae bacterium WSBS_2022_MAG_OTU7]